MAGAHDGQLFSARAEDARSAMTQTLSLLSLLVRDYDEAIAYYTGVLGFELVEDTPREPGKRWVVVRPRGGGVTGLVLARAATPEQTSRVGNQTGGRVGFFLHTDDIARDLRDYRSRGVVFVREPQAMPYGTVAVFQDLHGNLWDLIEPAPAA